MAKGRKAQAAALAKSVTPTAAPQPVRRIKPFVELNDENGATLRELDYYGLVKRKPSEDEVKEWNRYVGPTLGRTAGVGALTTGFLLTELLKEFPSVITFLPVDTEETWADATAWFATSKSPKYTTGERDLDPDYLAEGATPLLAALAFLALAIERKRWAFSPNSSSPRFLLWDMVNKAAPAYKPLYPAG